MYCYYIPFCDLFVTDEKTFPLVLKPISDRFDFINFVTFNEFKDKFLKLNLRHQIKFGEVTEIRSPVGKIDFPALVRKNIQNLAVSEVHQNLGFFFGLGSIRTSFSGGWNPPPSAVTP